ncbi:MAG: restriction endonuclease subunit S [Bacteroidaceae bacterium]|nr:restriction endonuclease subunit S [Bacteroidaceae bacterium]
MEEWKECKLGEVIQFNPKEKLAKGSLARKIAMDQLVPFCRDVSSVIYEEYKGGAKFRNGDTIMARITPCLENGKTSYISSLNDDEVAFGSTEYIVLRNIENISDSKFVYYLSICPEIREVAIKSMVGSSGRQRVQQDVLENYCISLPSLPTQQKIARILSSLDDKIEVNRRINEQLEELAQALFKSWFVDFEPFKEGEFQESELGRIPKGWKVVELENICTIKYGKGLGKAKLKDQGFPVFGGNGVIGYYDEYIYELPQILVSCRGAASGKIIESYPYSYVTSNSLILEIADRIYYNYLKYLLFRNPLYEYATGSAQPQITIDNIRKVKVLLPSLLAINKVNPTLSYIREYLWKNQQEILHLTALRDTLLPKLMSGEIAVDEVAL